MISANPFEIKGQSFTEKDHQKAIAEKSLLEAEFNTSPICNLKCPFCYTASNQKKSYRFISLDDITLFLRQVSEVGAKTVRIVGIGEPFLDNRIMDGDRFPFFELAAKHGITTVVYTNGTLIDETLAERLFDYDVSIVTKLYSFSPQIFEEMTGNQGHYSQEKQLELVNGKFIPRNLVNLINAGFNKEIPTRLGINNVITTQNIGELMLLYQFARFNNLAVRVSGFLAGQRAFDSRLIVILERLLTEYQRLIDWENEFSGFSWQPYGEIVGGQCNRLGYSITLDGTRFKVCCGDNNYLKDKEDRVLTLHNTTINKIVKTHSLFERIRSTRKKGIPFRCVMSENINSQVGDYNG